VNGSKVYLFDARGQMGLHFDGSCRAGNGAANPGGEPQISSMAANGTRKAQLSATESVGLNKWR
jgi:hypothetical protein